MRKLNRLSITLMLLAGLSTPITAFAHAILVKSQPEKDTEVSVAPKQIDLWFNDPVRSQYKALAVVDSDGKRVDNRDVAQEMLDGSHIYATVQDLTPGTYTVRYRVVSQDTHIVTGKFQFTVKPE
ncbi:copper resistance CopC family protein [Methylomonas sp. MgM2]